MAVPLTLPPGPPEASFTIQAAQTGSEHNQVDVQLTISNTGTEDANSIDLTSISLRTLGGSGRATILSPSAPIRIDHLAAGDSTDVTLKINIPPPLTKLGITEQVSVALGHSQLTKFSEGQVLYPQR
jgi:hypothetical protein